MAGIALRLLKVRETDGKASFKGFLFQRNTILKKWAQIRFVDYVIMTNYNEHCSQYFNKYLSTINLLVCCQLIIVVYLQLHPKNQLPKID